MKNSNIKVYVGWGRLLLGAVAIFFLMSFIWGELQAGTPSAESNIRQLSNEMGSRYARRPQPRLDTEFTCTGDGNPVFTAHVKKCSGFCLIDHRELQFTVEKGSDERSRRVVVTENTNMGPRCHASMTYSIGAFDRSAVTDLRFYNGRTQECEGDENLTSQPVDGSYLNIRNRQFWGEVDFSISQFAVVLSDSLDVLDSLDTQGRSCCTGQNLENCTPRLLKAIRNNPNMVTPSTEATR
jgi:hypothetical protein